MRPLVLLALVGCGAEGAAVVEMEQGLLAANDALAAVLVGHELFRHMVEPRGEPRHGSAVGCPFREQTGPDASHILLLDYPTSGCVASGLLPPRMAGHVWLDVTGTDGALARVDGAFVGGARLDGAVEASVERTGDGVTLSLAGPLEAGVVSAELDVDIVVDDFGPLTVEGWVDTNGGTVVLQDVVVTPDDVTGPCARPSDGAALWQGEREVALTFGDERVRAQSGRFVGMGWMCRYAVPFWP